MTKIKLTRDERLAQALRDNLRKRKTNGREEERPREGKRHESTRESTN